MIKLSDHFTRKTMLRFTFPSIMMMIFTSIYGMVDGFFISNFVGSTQFAAVNLIMPFIMIFGAVGMVFGTGGSALVSMLLGMKEEKKANETFSFLVYFASALGFVFMFLGIAITEPVAKALGASEAMLPYCVAYARVCFLGSVPFVLQNLFQAFFITAEKPHLGFIVTVAAGITNMILDGLFMGVIGWGVESAAAATVIGQVVGGVIPVFYFANNNNSSRLHFVAAKFDGRALVRTMTNGSSEFMSDISMSIVNMLYNVQLMKFAGEFGVSAYGVLMYAQFIFVGVYFGFSMGIAPVVSFHFGAQNTDELKSLLKKCLQIVLGFALILTALAEIFATPLSMIFVGYNKELLDITTNAFHIYAISFIFMGFNIFGSSFFTALNNGAISALISFMRTLVFQVIAILTLPQFFGINGIWFAVTAAEAGSIVLTIICSIANRKKYQYY